MPQWIHDRAEHLLAKNPSMRKSTAFALATQQSHRLGKSPKGYGTAKGKREAKAKYDQPKKEYTKTPNTGKLESPKLAEAQVQRMRKKASELQEAKEKMKNAGVGSLAAQGAKHMGLIGLKRGAVGGGVVGAGIGALTAEKGQGLSGALKGGLVGSAGGAALSGGANALKGAWVGKGMQRIGMPGNFAQGVQQMSSSPELRKEVVGGMFSRPSAKLAFAPFQSSPVKTAGPPCKSAAAIRTPASQLAKTQNIGVPKFKPPGKGIGQIAKPKGFGTVLPGLSSS